MHYGIVLIGGQQTLFNILNQCYYMQHVYLSHLLAMRHISVCVLCSERLVCVIPSFSLSCQEYDA